MLIMLRCTQRCNFDCIYCFQKERDAEQGEMSLDQLTKIFSKVKYYLTHYVKRDDRMTFEWTGGEPLLMGFDYFEQAFAMEERMFRNVRVGVSNAIQSNGSKITKRYIDLFKRYKVCIGISTDVMGRSRLCGNKNMNRLVFDKIMMLKREGVDCGCIVVPTKKNARYLKQIYRKLRDAHITFHFNYLKQFVDYDRNVAMSVDELIRSVMPVIKEYMLDRAYGRIDASFTLANIDEDIRLAMQNDMSQMSLCSYSNCFKEFLNIEPDGSAYPCPSFTFEETYLGNIFKDSLKSLMRHPFRKNIKKRRRKLEKVCSKCSLLPGCNGGCMAEAYHDGDMLGMSRFACEYRKKITEKIKKFVETGR